MPALTALVACGLPMVLWSLLVDKVHRNPTTGIDWEAPPKPLKETLDISIAKIAGLWGIWAVIGALYCIARWYWDGHYLFSMYVLGYAVGAAAGPLRALCALARPAAQAAQGRRLAFRPAADRPRRPRRPRRAPSFLSRLGGEGLLPRLHDLDRARAIGGRRSSADSAWIAANPVNLANWLIAIMFMVDVVFATVGYVLTLKPLDAHIRTANPYAAGWTAALICYPPFILMGRDGPLDYHQRLERMDLLAGRLSAADRALRRLAGLPDRRSTPGRRWRSAFASPTSPTAAS